MGNNGSCTNKRDNEIDMWNLQNRGYIPRQGPQFKAPYDPREEEYMSGPNEDPNGDPKKEPNLCFYSLTTINGNKYKVAVFENTLRINFGMDKIKDVSIDEIISLLSNSGKQIFEAEDKSREVEIEVEKTDSGTIIKIDGETLSDTDIKSIFEFFELYMKGGYMKSIYTKTEKYVDIGTIKHRVVYKKKGDRKQYVRYNKQYVLVTELRASQNKKSSLKQKK